MRHLELHMLQSVPVSCLNRDDLGSPKTALFGGVQRARVSSQCWKRAVRELAKKMFAEESIFFCGFRTKNTYDKLINFLQEFGLEKDQASLGAEYFSASLHSSKFDDSEKDDSTDIKSMSENGEENKTDKTKVLFFTTDVELQCFAKCYVNSAQRQKLQPTQNKKGKTVLPSKKTILAAIKSITNEALKELGSKQFSNAADIALFGRMVASLPHLKVEGAAMFAHALSTHRVDNEIDFFSALDDLQPESESGAGMIGGLEFNAATYYRFAALNLDMLADDAHLGGLSPEERQDVVATFVEATLKAMPGARKNSMNASTLPVYVRCVLRDTGHPIQLVNAFERPVYSSHGKGYVQASIEAMEKECAHLENTWGIKAASVITMPEKSLTELLQEVRAYVR